MRLAFALAVSFVVGACGSDLTADKACTDVAAARCTQIMTCSAADLSRRWPDLATCEAREKLACTEGLSAPNTGASPSSVDACSTALTAQTCSAYLAGFMPPTQCLAQSGPAAAGAACGFAAQCKSGFCAIATGSLCGTCANLPAVGDSCATSGCGPTLECVASTMTCQMPLAANGSCSKSAPCGGGLSCVGATGTANGTCMPEGTTAGAACDVARKTAPGCSASAGLTCDSGSKMCVTQPLVAAGQPCGVTGTTFTGCLAGATCFFAAGSNMGTCMAPAADGGACDTTLGPDCEFPARCISGTCQLPGSMTCM